MTNGRVGRLSLSFEIGEVEQRVRGRAGRCGGVNWGLRGESRLSRQQDLCTVYSSLVRYGERTQSMKKRFQGQRVEKLYVRLRAPGTPLAATRPHFTAHAIRQRR